MPGQKLDQIRPSQHSEQPQREHSQDHRRIFRECRDEIASEEQAKSEEKENRSAGYMEDWHRQNREHLKLSSRPQPAEEEAQQAKHRNDEAANDENVHKKSANMRECQRSKNGKNMQA